MQTSEPGRTQAADLADLAARLADAAAPTDPTLSKAARTVRTRLETGRFDIAVVGEFKRGKSTLLNALLGREVLPVGVLPTTAVATEISFGVERVVVHHRDAPSRDASIDELHLYVTEESNPENLREVARVDVRVLVELLHAGAVLVDTPGLGSAFAHNTDLASAAIDRSDGAIVVFSADAPFSEHERELLERLRERSVKTFFVLNRIDHLEPSELERVRQFVRHQLSDRLGRDDPLYCVSARAALMAKLAGDLSGIETSGFAEFERALRTFVEEDLVDARLQVARRDLVHLLGRLDDALEIETAARRLDAEELERRIHVFEQAAATQRAGIEEDRLLLSHAVGAIRERLGSRLAGAGHAVPPDAREQLALIADITAIGELDPALDAAVEEIVRATFERVRAEEVERAAREWREAAAAFRARAQTRVDAIRDVARDVFELHLRAFEVPDFEEAREDFFFLFLRLETPNQVIGRWARRLLPARVVRRRLLQDANRRLASELDKHAGRARWDLSQRLDQLRHSFEQSLRAEVTSTVDGVLQALERAQQQRAAFASNASERERDQAAQQVTIAAIRSALSMGSPGG